MQDEEVCDCCGKRFAKWRYDQRFCSIACKDTFHNAERREAMRAWREQQRESAA